MKQPAHPRPATGTGAVIIVAIAAVLALLYLARWPLAG